MVATGDAVLEEAVAGLTSQISVWIKGLGLLALGVAAYSIAMFLMNRKQAKDLEKIKSDLEEINKKLDSLSKKK